MHQDKIVRYFNFLNRLYLKKIKEVDQIYGLRDYYCLIKSIFKDYMALRNKNNKHLFKIIKKNLYRNFWGVKKDCEKMFEDFSEMGT